MSFQNPDHDVANTRASGLIEREGDNMGLGVSGEIAYKATIDTSKGESEKGIEYSGKSKRIVVYRPDGSFEPVRRERKSTVNNVDSVP